MLRRPWTEAGFGWVIAVLIFLIALLSLFVHMTVPHLVIWLIIGICVALIIG
jgi:hypothetical protein